MTLGIGVITFKRKLLLRLCLDAIQEHTKVPYFLVIADDGSKDGTLELSDNLEVTTITGINKGVCWNKNRALYTLQKLGADQIILLEDDCWPNKDTWAETWIEAVNKYHHVNYRHPYWPSNWCVGGKGTAEAPWTSWEITGQATITTKEALDKVGYLNTSFKGYGYGNIEWTERFCKAKYLKRHSIPCLDYGLKLQKSATYINQSQIRYNQRIYFEQKKKPFEFCNPWQNKEEEGILLHEIEKGLTRNQPKIH